MPAKRFFSESEDDPDRPYEKRMKPRHSFASVIREVVMVNWMQHLSSALEPLLRKVVGEEVEGALARYGTNPLMKTPSLPSSLQLTFAQQLWVPIFTGTKLVDAHGSPLEILLVGGPVNPIKVEMVVLDGDFPGNSSWTPEDFHNNMLRERTGKRPLLTGDVNLTMRHRSVLVGDLEFTDNSSWVRSRKFRLGARVVSGTNQGLRIREAITHPFVVKDHRGELYKKHHPPLLDDEVWRLEKIGKEGAFHKKLSSEGINTVEDFLKLSVVDPPKLRNILGAGMSEKMWEVTIKHARECVMGNKLYMSKGHNYTIFLNPICQVVRAIINGRVYPTRELSAFNRRDIEKLVKEAYQNWDSLEVVDGIVNETLLLTQGEIVEDYHSYNINDNNNEKVMMERNENGRGIENNYEHEEGGCSNWQLSSTYYESAFRYGIVGDSSDGDLTPSASTKY